MSTKLAHVEKIQDLEERRGALSEQQSGQLLQMALEQKVSVDVLERLVALHERMEATRARAAFNAALAAFQSEVEPLTKNREVSFTARQGGRVSYHYATLDSIEKTCRPALLKHGLSYNWDTDVDGGRMIVICRVMHELGHSESTRWSCEVEKQAKMNLAQSTASTTTYGKRQSLISALGLSTAEDDMDGESGADAPKISEEALANVNALMDEIFGTKRDSDSLGQFYMWLSDAFGTNDVNELRMDQVPEVIKMLERKRRQMERKS